MRIPDSDNEQTLTIDFLQFIDCDEDYESERRREWRRDDRDCGPDEDSEV